MEIKTELKTFRIEKKCDQCPKGTMISTGKSVTEGSVTTYAHRCNYCGALEDLPKVYPTVSSEVIPETTKEVKEKPAPKPAAAPRKAAAKKAAAKKTSKK